MPLITSRLTLLRVTIALILPVILLACDPDAPPATLTSEEATPTSMVAQTSAETDREALVALYNATDGRHMALSAIELMADAGAKGGSSQRRVSPP